MKIIQKILFIAILGWCIGNTEEMQAQASTLFDLPDNTPGLRRIGNQDLLIERKILNIKKRCLLVIIPGTAAESAINQDGGNLLSAMKKQGNIYFPADGTQPTTPEAVEYSCANIDNRENSPITEWYMQMFGVIPYKRNGTNDDDYIKAGWSPPPRGDGEINTRRIISFPAANFGFLQIDAIQDVADPDVPDSKVSRFTLFERNFRKIASTSVGRVLLYRILIEIRRHQNGNSTGYQEEGIPLNILKTRNLHRSIHIYGCQTRGSFSIDNGFIVFRMKPAKIYPAIGKKNAMGYTHIQYSEASLDISLFHEMLHWYHALRDTDRSTNESNYDGYYSLVNHPFGNYYWDGLDLTEQEAKRAISERPWKVEMPASGSERYVVSFEEMRTILGVPNAEGQTYRAGDDLSENLYRVCLGSPLCFGYTTDFYEDNNVVEKVILSCVRNYALYIKMDDISIEYNDPQLRQGLGFNQTKP